MTQEERAKALNNIGAIIPRVVFDRFIIILTQISGCNDDRLIETLNRICTNKSDGFCYTMGEKDKQETITPIREAIDLLEGWILTATVNTTHDRVKWHIQSIIGKVE